MKTFLGIDWGGTYIKAGVVDSAGKILKKILYSSNKLGEKKNFLNEIASLVKDLKPFNIQAVGIGAPGIINTKKGLIYYLPNVPGWENYSLTDNLKKKINLPVYVNNDANVFALAESLCGAAAGKARSIFLTLGTGVGGSVIFDGKILNTEVSSLELGHVPITMKGKLCGCGGRGCIETFVGNKQLVEKYKQLTKIKEKIEVRDIYIKALNGEKEALIVWKEFSFALGFFLSGMINIFNPEVIVLGGGVSGAFKVFKPFLWEVIKEQSMWPQIKKLQIKKAKLKDAGIIGAGLLARDSFLLHG